ncbi:MAG: plastocyanin/azurin family copper-binding protein [Gemmatimonadaceae bacterium]
MIHRIVTPLAIAALAARTAVAQQPTTRDTGAASAAPAVVQVEMVDGGPYAMAFAPVRVSARLGDTVRFVQRGRVPHNVVFRSVPPGADLTALGAARDGPLLQRAGATYDVVLDGRFRPGKYVYVCAPHEVLGMAGVLNVRPAGGAP